MKRICARSGLAHSGGANSDQNQSSERFIRICKLQQFGLNQGVKNQRVST